MNYIHTKYRPKESWGEGLSTQGAVAIAHISRRQPGGHEGRMSLGQLLLRQSGLSQSLWALPLQ